MGKDRSGKFHPKKGKPSGNKEEGLGVSSVLDPESVKKNLEISDKYTIGADTLDPSVHMLHPNRNTQKKIQQSEEQDDNNSSDKTIREKLNDDIVETVIDELPYQLSKEAFAELANHTSEVAMSIFIPTHKGGVEVNEQQDIIIYKNALQEAEKLLKEKKIDELQILKLLKPGYDLLRKDKFWYNQNKGLALFISDNHFKYIKLPFEPKEEILLNNSFLVAPLAPILLSNEYFYLLVMSKKQAKLFRADKFGIEAINVPGLPEGVDDVVHFEEKEDQKLFRTGGRGGTGGANFHGIGAGKPDEKKNIELYLEEVDDTIWKEVLHNETVPLLLAGIEYMIPIYRSVSDYNFVWQDAIAKGALEHENSNVLYEMAMEKMKPYFDQKLEKAKNEYGNKSAGSLTTSIATEVIPACYYGQVDTLFVQKDAHIWGRFDKENNKLEIHNEHVEGDDCMIDKAVIQTILNSGNAFLLPAEEMPVQSKVAAILRYPYM
jgi:hypothetical protein